MNKKFRYYTFGLDSRSNFWLSINYQKFASYEYRNLIGKLRTDPFVYFTSKENKILLGVNNYKKKIDNFIHNQFINQVVIGKNRYNKNLYGYKPLIKPIGVVKSYDKSFDTYYNYLIDLLSIYGKIILHNLNYVSIDINQDYFFMVVKKFLYPKYLNRVNVDEQIKYDDYLKRFEWVYNYIQRFNDSSGVELVNFVKEDNYGNRIHTIISLLSKEFRRHILIDNQETVEIDLEQSQPNICSALIKQSIGDNSFSRIVEKNNIYKYIQYQLGFKSIEESKDFYFKSAYGKSYSNESKILYHMFPDIEKYITDIKTNPLVSNPNYKYYTNYAHLAQRKETEIFRKIWYILYKYNILFIPVHDSIRVKVSQLDTVLDIMYSVLKKEIHPNIKLKFH